MTGSKPICIVQRAEPLPTLDEGWNHRAWDFAQTIQINHFRPESSGPRPRTQARLLHGSAGLRGVFRIDGEYVRSVRTQYFDEVWKDSCVEFFLQPREDSGYFNLEMNAGGAHLCCFIEDPTRTPDGFKKFTRLPADIGKRIQIRSSLPCIIDPESPATMNWELNFFLPWAVLENSIGPLGELHGQQWHGNFFKCAEEVSRPHWAAWAEVDEFNFHLPHCFGTLQFE